MNLNKIERCGTLPPTVINPHDGYKETKVMWLSAEVRVLSNNDIPLNEDIALALDSIQETVRRARIDRLVEEYAEWMHRRGIIATGGTETEVIREAV